MIHVSRIVAIVVVCYGIDRAHASCAVALDGEPAVVDDVRAALADFGDDSGACVKLWVQCRAAGGELEIDLHDELGRSSLRLFESARGAATFIISWSRRPLPERITAIEVAGPRPVRSPAPAMLSSAGLQDPLWHLEFDAGAIVASGNSPQWATTSIAVIRGVSIFRFGGELRMMMEDYLGNRVGELIARFGAVHALGDRWAVLADLTAGTTISGVGIGTTAGPNFGEDGLRTGVRAVIHRRLAASLGIEIGGGIDVLRQVHDGPLISPPIPVAYVPCAYIEVGVRWVP